MKKKETQTIQKRVKIQSKKNQKLQFKFLIEKCLQNKKLGMNHLNVIFKKVFFFFKKQKKLKASSFRFIILLFFIKNTENDNTHEFNKNYPLINYK